MINAVDAPNVDADELSPERWLSGYLHATFNTEADHLDLAAVPPVWNVVMLAFGETTSAESGEIRFVPKAASHDLARTVALARARGQRVLLSIGGRCEIRLTSTSAREAFLRSVSDIVERYGLDGIDVDLERWSLWLDQGDDDFRQPTTPVVVNLIWALKRLKQRYGTELLLTMAPETFFVQAGLQRYGGGVSRDPRAGVYLPVIEAMREDLALVQAQNYNSGPVLGLDGRFHHVGDAKFQVAMADMLLSGFPVGRNATHFFEPLEARQVALGFLSAPVDDGYLAPSEVSSAVESIVHGTPCGGYVPVSGANPTLRGLMAWSINWDCHHGWQFMRNYETVRNSLAPSTPGGVTTERRMNPWWCAADDGGRSESDHP